MEITSRAAAILKEKLLESCYHAGIGFRMRMAVNDCGEKTLFIQPDAVKEDDKTLELDGVKVFMDPECVARVQWYQLDCTDEPSGTLLIR